MEMDVLKAQKGDKDAFTRLIKAMEPNLYRIASSIMRSETECLDAIQETILKAYLYIDTLKQPQYFKTWLTRILIRECTYLLKKRNKVISIDQLEIKEHHAPSGMEEKMDLHEAISRLEKDFRIVITLFYIQDLSIKEVSDIIEQPEGTVKSRLSRARKKLSELLCKENSDGGLQYEQL